jgi:hypothetical protein
MNLPAQWKQLGILLAGMLAVGLITATCGCQVEMGGQTLPSPYYMQDDVQYFAPGPEFRLAREAAALKAARGEIIPTPQPAPEGAAPAGPGENPPAAAQPPAPAAGPPAGAP